MQKYDEEIRQAHLSDDAGLLAFLTAHEPFLHATAGQIVAGTLRSPAFGEWVTLQESLKEVLAQHPLFGHPPEARFGTHGVCNSPGAIAPRVLEVAGEQGAAGAIAWLRRIFSCSATDLMTISVISGLTVTSEIAFANGVHIGTAASLPASAQVQSLAAPERSFTIDIMPRWGGPDCFAWKTVEASVGKLRGKGSYPDEEARAETQELLVALALDSVAAPTSSSWWSEYTHPDFRILQRGSGGSMGQKDDGPEQHLKATLELNTPLLVDRYFATSGRFRNKCRAALTGLHLSRRVRSPSSRAIELCIGLEAILGGDSNQEIIHKVSTRGAVVLSEGFERRKKTRKAFKALYDLRSKAVHGNASEKNDAYEIVNEGARLANALYRLAVERGEELQLEEIDLMGCSSPS